MSDFVLDLRQASDNFPSRQPGVGRASGRVYHSSVLNALFAKLTNAARDPNLKVILKTRAQLADASGKYVSSSPAAGGTTSIRSDLERDTAVHETVHHINRVNGWHQGNDDNNVQGDEANAWGIQRLLNRTSFLKSLERIQPGATAAADATRAWQLAWTAGYMGIYQEDVPPQVIARKHTPIDLWDINAKHGVRFSESTLRPIYEALLAAKGITVTLPAMSPTAIPAGDPLQ